MIRKPRKLEQVTQAAIAEFQENGFVGANMDRISDRAQVSKRTLYNYFDSKEALFQEMITLTVQLFADDAPSAFAPEVQIEPQLHDLALRLARPYTVSSAVMMARLVIGEMLRNREAVSGMLPEVEQASPVDTFFSSVAASGAISKQAASVLAVDFHAFIKGRCMWPAILSGEPISRSDAERVAQSASNMFAGRI